MLPTTLAQSAGAPGLEAFISQMEVKYDLPRGILKAIIYVETKGNPKAFVREDGKSKHSSFGIMQIQYGSAKQVGFKGKPNELMQPHINIEYGAAYLRWLLDRSEENYSRALSCFNHGPFSIVCKTNKPTAYSMSILNALFATSR